MDQGSTMKRSAVHNFVPTVTKFCVMWEGQALPHDTKFGNSRCEIVGRRVIFIWSLIHGLRWSGLIKAEPGGDELRIIKYVACDDDVMPLKRLARSVGMSRCRQIHSYLAIRCLTRHSYVSGKRELVLRVFKNENASHSQCLRTSSAHEG